MWGKEVDLRVQVAQADDQSDELIPLEQRHLRGGFFAGCLRQNALPALQEKDNAVPDPVVLDERGVHDHLPTNPTYAPQLAR